MNDVVLAEIAREIDSYGGKARDVIDGYSTAMSVHPSTLYRKLKEGGYWSSGRKKREDKGIKKCGITDTHLAMVAKMRGADPQSTTPTYRIIETLKDNMHTLMNVTYI